MEKLVEWDPAKTAFIICDMWDDHWCRGAAGVVESVAGGRSAGPRLRERGVLVIHAPSTCVDFYRDTPQRKLALSRALCQVPGGIVAGHAVGNEMVLARPAS